MEMMVGSKAVRAALRSDLADSGPAGLEMHVALANPLGPPNGQGMVRCRATTEAWDALLRWCIATSRTPVGATAQQRRDAAAAMRTRRRIESELDRLARHPGYEGKAMVGVESTVLPARRYGSGRWWPTRRMALLRGDGSAPLEATMLVPEMVTRNGRVFTTWVPAEDDVAEVPPGLWG